MPSIAQPTLIYRLTIRLNGQLEFKKNVSCEKCLTRDDYFWAFETASRVLSLRRTSVRTAEIAQVFTKVSYNARLVVHNGIFLFVRSVLTVRVMYWARVEDYFYPFHEVCMHLL